MNFHRQRQRETPEINLIALIDVLLVILIFLMVSTHMRRYAELQVDLPAGHGVSVQEQSSAIYINVAANGQMQVGPTSVLAGDSAALLAALRQQAKDKVDLVVVIKADRQAKYQTVIDVMEAARAVGLNQLSFATVAEDRRQKTEDR